MKSTKSQTKALSRPHAPEAESLRVTGGAGRLVPKKPTKSELPVEMVKRPGGAFMDELVAAFKIPQRTARAVVSTQRVKREIDIKFGKGRSVVGCRLPMRCRDFHRPEAA